jgi:hypothetical protein
MVLPTYIKKIERMVSLATRERPPQKLRNQQPKDFQRRRNRRKRETTGRWSGRCDFDDDPDEIPAYITGYVVGRDFASLSSS